MTNRNEKKIDILGLVETRLLDKIYLKMVKCIKLQLIKRVGVSLRSLPLPSPTAKSSKVFTKTYSGLAQQSNPTPWTL
jgi:hypothetical protein